MLSQGWVAGQGLGATNRRGFNSYENAKLKVSFKDDNLGLGASARGRDVDSQRTGLDAFQGLLGRLNGKDEGEIAVVEKKVEDRKLAMFAAGRWGGMVFVPGGLLVQREVFRKDDGVSEEQREFKAMRNDAEAIRRAKGRGNVDEDAGEEDEEAAAKAKRKQDRAEKRQRKEDKRRRKAEKSSEMELGSVSTSNLPPKLKHPKPPPTPASASSPPSSTASDDARPIPPPSRPTIRRNGRQILRGKNIAAKKMAFADAKMLDEIFMRKS